MRTVAEKKRKWKSTEREREEERKKGKKKECVEEIDSEQNVERYPFVVNAWNGQHKKAIIAAVAIASSFDPTVIIASALL